jgi:hypothetical protein
MRYKLLIIVGALIVIGAAAASVVHYAFPVQVPTLAGMTRNYFISLVAPAGTVTTESNAAYKGTRAIERSPAAEALSPSARDWREHRRV